MILSILHKHYLSAGAECETSFCTLVAGVIVGWRRVGLFVLEHFSASGVELGIVTVESGGILLVD